MGLLFYILGIVLIVAAVILAFAHSWILAIILFVLGVLCLSHRYTYGRRW